MKMPVMLELSKKKVLIVGGGKTALRLIKHLKQFYVSVTCISKIFEPKFAELKTVECIKDIIRHNAIKDSYFDGVDIVIACTNNTILNENIYKYCSKKRILCQTTHKGGSKDFDFMEYNEKNGLLMAAYTSGANPAFSSEIINNFMNSLDEETIQRLEMLIEEKRLVASLKHN